MRVGLYGGSFDPPHVGHVQVASYVLATSSVDELWLVPCASHAFAKELESYDHRMAMCRLAVRDSKRTVVSDVEGRLGGTSRTIDTVRHLLADRPGLEIDLVVGADIFPERHDWKAFDELERLCGFLIVGRPGAYPTPDGYDVAPPLLDVSSTEIREALGRGEAVTNRVPRAVAAYIEEHGLYGSGGRLE